MVQLGLCAFRHSMIREAHNALQDIQSTGRAKELLAQGLILKNQDRTPEQEKLEKRRMVCISVKFYKKCYFFSIFRCLEMANCISKIFSFIFQMTFSTQKFEKNYHIYG